MTDNTDKIIDKVQKLLNLAGNNPNEAEAAAAVKKAHDLLAAHNLDMAHVKEFEAKGLKEPEDMLRTKLDIETKIKVRAYSWLWNSVAKAHFCKLYQRTNHRGQRIYTFVGRKINTIVAAQMAQYLSTTVWRLMREEAKKVDAVRPGAGFKATGALNSNFVTNFIEGAVMRLCKRLEEMETTGGNKNALVLYNADEAKLNEAYIREELGINLKHAKSSARANHNSDAYNRGDAAGSGISFNQQVGGSSPKPQINNIKQIR
jgi:hypothetical protein